MERLYKNIVGTPVYEDDFPRPFSTVKDVVMDPETGKFLAFIVDVNKGMIISGMDIVSWNHVVKINSMYDVVPENEILRVHEVLKRGIKIYGNKVETQEGDLLGRVTDFSINSSTNEMKDLYVGKTVLGVLRYDSRIIPAKNIIEVLVDKIVVKENLKTVKEKVKGKIKMEDLAVS